MLWLSGSLKLLLRAAHWKPTVRAVSALSPRNLKQMQHTVCSLSAFGFSPGHLLATGASIIATTTAAALPCSVIRVKIAADILETAYSLGFISFVPPPKYTQTAHSFRMHGRTDF